jgi:phosphoribosylformylglycinamidine synthase PurS subunit
MKFEVVVQLKANVFNAEEKELLSSISSFGHGIENVKVAKLFTIEVQKSSINPEETVKEIAQSILTNSVIETFSIRKIND